MRRSMERAIALFNKKELVVAVLSAAMLVGACGSTAVPASSTGAIGAASPGPAEAGTGCAGADTADWSIYPKIVRLWGEAWMATDEAARTEALDEVWAEDGVYVNAYVEAPVVGREALAETMAFGIGPGQYVEVSEWTPEDLLDDRLRIRWRQCCPSGLSLVQGTDVGEIGADGRLERVTSFWNNAVALPADVACN